MMLKRLTTCAFVILCLLATVAQADSIGEAVADAGAAKTTAYQCKAVMSVSKEQANAMYEEHYDEMTPADQAAAWDAISTASSIEDEGNQAFTAGENLWNQAGVNYGTAMMYWNMGNIPMYAHYRDLAIGNYRDAEAAWYSAAVKYSPMAKSWYDEVVDIAEEYE